MQARFSKAEDQGKGRMTERIVDRPYNVLFLCTGNSARSILAEAIIDLRGGGKFKGHSAGSFPKGELNAFALELLDRLGIPTTHLRSKSWGEFAAPGSPVMDFVFTVCDQAAGEACPIWPGRPVTAHWGIPDPAAVKGSQAERGGAFAYAYRMLERRIKLFLSLPLSSLDRVATTRKLREIGRARGDAAEDRAS
jgi:arsenate reductase